MSPELRMTVISDHFGRELLILSACQVKHVILVAH